MILGEKKVAYFEIHDLETWERLHNKNIKAKPYLHTFFFNMERTWSAWSLCPLCRRHGWNENCLRSRLVTDEPL